MSGSLADLAVIFDMDGVLVDSEPLQEAALAEFLRRRGKGPLTHGEYEGTIGLGHEAFWGWMIARFALSESVEECLADFHEILLPLLAQLEPAAGARELVRALADAGVPMAVASSSHRPIVEATLASIGLRDRFTAVVTGGEVSPGKPDPAIYLLAAERLGVDPSRCVAVEDSPHGVRAAVEAGMACLGVVTAYARPESLGASRVVGSLAEVSPADLAALRAS